MKNVAAESESACNAAEACNYLFGSAGFIEAMSFYYGQINFEFSHWSTFYVKSCAASDVAKELESIAARLRLAVFQLKNKSPTWPTTDYSSVQRPTFNLPAAAVCERLESLSEDTIKAVTDGKGRIDLHLKFSRCLDGSHAPKTLLVKTIQDIAAECERLAVEIVR